MLNWLAKSKQASLFLEGIDRHFFKPDKPCFSFFYSFVEDKELDAPDDPDLLKELPLDELDEGEEEDFPSGG